RGQGAGRPRLIDELEVRNHVADIHGHTLPVRTAGVPSAGRGMPPGWACWLYALSLVCVRCSRVEWWRVEPMKGEHFLPFRRRDVVDMCADQLIGREQDDFRAFAKVLASLLHYRFQERIEALKDAYHYFDVESDTRLIDGALSPEAKDQAQ